MRPVNSFLGIAFQKIFRVKILDLSYRIREPFDALTIDPQPYPAFAGGVGEPALTMLFAIIPVAFILLAVRPHIDAPAVLFIVDVISIITTTIRPCINSFVVQLILAP